VLSHNWFTAEEAPMMWGWLHGSRERDDRHLVKGAAQSPLEIAARSASSAASLAPVALRPPREPHIPQRRQHGAAQPLADQPALDQPPPFASVKIASQW
jgi:hypothetical protein